MKRIFILLLTLCLFACSNKKNSPQLFSASMLARQSFLIDAQKDTSLTTLHGSIIRIVSGSFAGTAPIEIEIREALTATEILAAGLVTESNGMPLRSGGMIYINAVVNGNAAELLKPIKVSIPNQSYDSAMQVYKGIDTGGNGINWVDPVAADTNSQSATWLAGKKLFQARCANCHQIFKNRTGPALANLENRGPWIDRKELYSYIRNTQLYIEHSDYAKQLQAQYKSVMTPFPGLSNTDIDNIITYINNESKNSSTNQNVDEPREDLKTDSTSGPSTEPCSYTDTTYLAAQKQTQTFLETIPADTFNSSTPVIDTVPQKLKDPSQRNSDFTDPLPTNGMYDFEIKTLGWYNIDADMQGYAGTTGVKIFASLQNTADVGFHVYLFCPDKQVLSVANKMSGDKYSFEKINGTVPLFLEDRAILFAFGSKGDMVYYGIADFIIKQEQTIQINIIESTTEAIRQALLTKEMNGIDLGIEKKDMVIREFPCDPVAAGADTTSK
jgi:cytochrome c2